MIGKIFVTVTRATNGTADYIHIMDKNKLFINKVFKASEIVLKDKREKKDPLKKEDK